MCCRPRVTATSARGSASPPRADDRLRRPRPVRRGAPRPAARARLRGSVSEDRVLDWDAQQAIYAFQKAQRLERTGVAGRVLAAAPGRRRSCRATASLRATSRSSRRARSSRTSATAVPCSSRPSRPVAATGRPRALLHHRQDPRLRSEPARRPLQADVLLRRVRDSRQPVPVPPYPASHGCVRVPNFVADRLYSTEPCGEAVIVY